LGGIREPNVEGEEKGRKKVMAKFRGKMGNEKHVEEEITGPKNNRKLQ